jgi:hypothetical protein
VSALRRGALSRGGAGLRLVRDVEDDLDVAVAAARAFEAACELVEREAVAARPDERFHIEVGARVAVDRDPLVATLWRGPGDEAPDANAPAEPPGLSEGVDSHENKMRTYER